MTPLTLRLTRRALAPVRWRPKAGTKVEAPCWARERREMSIETEATKATDPLYAKACEFVQNTGKTSISSLQREFQLGYNRAARHLEAMEADGIISPMDRYGVRKLLVPNK